jgi:hypothetical protein
MKMSRSKLKELIKECIVEVLAEGLGGSTALSEASVKVNPASRKHKKPQTPPRRKVLDSIKFDKRVNEAASSMTADPVMQSIFSDTAKTTLQDQLQHSNSTPSVPAGADAATRAAALSTPEDLFEGSSNWAALAFNEGTNK